MGRFKVDPTRRTCSTSGLELYRLALRSGRAGIWLHEAREWAAAQGLTRTQLADALRYSGMYPIKIPVGAAPTTFTTWWAVDKPRWWVLDRVPGKRPPLQRQRCWACGHKTERVAPPPGTPSL